MMDPTLSSNFTIVYNNFCTQAWTVVSDFYTYVCYIMLLYYLLFIIVISQ